METLFSTPSPGTQNNPVTGGFNPIGQRLGPGPSRGPDFYGQGVAEYSNFSGMPQASYPMVMESLLLETAQAMNTNGADAWGQAALLVSHPAGGVGREETRGLSVESPLIETDNVEFPNPERRMRATVTTHKARRALHRRSHCLDPQGPIQVGTG